MAFSCGQVVLLFAADTPPWCMATITLLIASVQIYNFEITPVQIDAVKSVPVKTELFCIAINFSIES